MKLKILFNEGMETINNVKYLTGHTYIEGYKQFPKLRRDIVENVKNYFIDHVGNLVVEWDSEKNIPGHAINSIYAKGCWTQVDEFNDSTD